MTNLVANTPSSGEIAISGLEPKICKMSLGPIAKLERKPRAYKVAQAYINKVLSLFPLLLHLWLPLLGLFRWLILFDRCLISTGVPHGSVLGPGLRPDFTVTLGYFSDPHGFNNHPYSDAFQMHVSPPTSPKSRSEYATAHSAHPPACCMGISNPACINSAPSFYSSLVLLHYLYVRNWHYHLPMFASQKPGGHS